LQSIDYLISFAEKSPLELLKMVHPDVFVKGSDYTERSIPEMPLLKKLGCEVKIIASQYRISTTDIIHKINDINEDADAKTELKKSRKMIAVS
jgi:D-beta-D-heptose 7-phosphate kinase/D-beta-D-heptose 1-phosphate adenosyltransferase